MPSNPPYLERTITTVVRVYNPNYGDNRLCLCRQPYYRHFDSYEDMGGEAYAR